jgi:hypothetical protein
MNFGFVNSEFVLDDNTEFTKFHVNFDRFGPIRFCNDSELNSIGGCSTLYIAKGMKTVTGCPKKPSCVSICLLVCVNLFARSIFFFAHQNVFMFERSRGE